MRIAEWIALLVAAYSAFGALFAVYFLWRGANRLDDAARNSGVAFHLILLPGAVALWPVLAVLCLRSTKGGHS